MENPLDIRTLTLVNVLISSAYGYVLMRYSARHSFFNGIGTLGMGFILLGCGFAILGFRSFISHFFSILVANFFLVLGCGYICAGVLRYVDLVKKWLNPFIYSLSAFVFMALAYFTYVQFDTSVRIIIVSVVYSILFFIAAILIGKKYFESKARDTLWLSVIFSLFGFTFVVRTIFTALAPPLNDLMAAGLLHSVPLLVLTLMLIIVGIGVISSATSQLEERLTEIASRDVLTGIYNRRALEDFAQREISRTNRMGEHLSAIIMDIDHFKNLNDTYGHQAGDVVLKWFAGVMAHNIREHDVLARYGGEEFVVLLPDTTAENAEHVAEKLRSEIERAAVRFGKTQNLTMTASFGVASTYGERANWHTLIRAADAALYEAKCAGRNQVRSKLL